MQRFVSLLLAGTLCAAAAQAAVIEAGFTQLNGTDWQVDFRVTNDGSPAVITGFTVYFPETLFANLALVSSPPEWDSLVIEPDVALPAPGFFDALLLDPSQSMLVGQSAEGFRVAVEFLGAGAPSALPFQIVDQSFQPLFQGTTVPLANQVPEPSSVALVALGLGLIGTAAGRRATQGALVRLTP